MLPWDLQPVSPCASSTTFRTVETDVPTDQLQPRSVPFSLVSVGLEPGVHADRNRNAFLFKRGKRRAPIPSRRDPVDRGRGRSLPERCGPLAVFERSLDGPWASGNPSGIDQQRARPDQSTTAWPHVRPCCARASRPWRAQKPSCNLPRWDWTWICTWNVETKGCVATDGRRNERTRKNGQTDDNSRKKTHTNLRERRISWKRTTSRRRTNERDGLSDCY